MIRRLNYTGRRKIPRGRITVRLTDAGDEHYAFRAEFDLADMGFPDDAQVFIEAYNSISWMRFDFGTVGARHDPDDLRLVEVTRHPLPKFRLKVVDRSEDAGRLLGVADKLVPLRPEEDETHRQSLLPVEFCDLGDEVWRLDVSDWPVLALNHRIEGIGEAARAGDDFLGLVYPEVVRNILHEIVIEQEQFDPDFDDSDWTCLWLRYVCQFAGVEPPRDGYSEAARAERLEWIADAVQAFSRAYDARRRYAGMIATQEAR